MARLLCGHSEYSLCNCAEQELAHLNHIKQRIDEQQRLNELRKLIWNKSGMGMRFWMLLTGHKPHA